eukprot:765682-Hanusia_phi.AAC.1
MFPAIETRVRSAYYSLLLPPPSFLSTSTSSLPSSLSTSTSSLPSSLSIPPNLYIFSQYGAHIPPVHASSLANARKKKTRRKGTWEARTKMSQETKRDASKSWKRWRFITTSHLFIEVNCFLPSSLLKRVDHIFELAALSNHLTIASP